MAIDNKAIEAMDFGIESNYGEGGLFDKQNTQFNNQSASSYSLPVGSINTDNTAEYKPQVYGGTGYSSLGASLGSLAGQEGAVIGGAVGSVADIATGMYNAYEERKAQRDARDKAEMASARQSIANQIRQSRQDKIDDETNAYNSEVRKYNLKDIKMKDAIAKSERMNLIISGYMGKKYKTTQAMANFGA